MTTTLAAGAAAPELGDDAARLRLVDAIQGLGGAFTLGDLVARTGLPPHEADRQLTAIVRDYECELDVDDEGRLRYDFGPAGLAARPDIVAAERRRRRREALKVFLVAAFKVWTVAMVILYFVIYVCLIIAALVAASQAKGNSNGGGRSSGGRRSGGGGGGAWIMWYHMGGFFDGRRRRRRHRRQLDRSLEDGLDPYQMGGRRPKKLIRRGGKEIDPDKPTLVERTWYFLFGTRGIERTPLEQEKELLTYVRAKKGLLTNADIVALLGVPYAEADRIATRLVATYGGEMDITDDGVCVYRFPDLMFTARPEIEKAEPTGAYLWELRQKEHALRAHPSIVIPALNGFNLVLAFVTYFKLLPILGISGFWAVFFLVVFPGAFSLMFYGIALSRWLRERAYRKRYERDNIRISMIRLLFTRRRPIVIPGDEEAIAEAGLGGWASER